MGIESVKMVAIIEIVDPLGEPSHPTTSALKRKDHVHPRRKYVDVCVCGRLDACRASLKYRSYQMQSVWRSVGSQVAHYRLRVSDTETGQ